MKKCSWKFYRSPNPYPRGVKKCNSAEEKIWEHKNSKTEVKPKGFLKILCRHMGGMMSEYSENMGTVKIWEKTNFPKLWGS